MLPCGTPILLGGTSCGPRWGHGRWGTARACSVAAPVGSVQPPADRGGLEHAVPWGVGGGGRPKGQEVPLEPGADSNARAVPARPCPPSVCFLTPSSCLPGPQGADGGPPEGDVSASVSVGMDVSLCARVCLSVHTSAHTPVVLITCPVCMSVFVRTHVSAHLAVMLHLSCVCACLCSVHTHVRVCMLTGMCALSSSPLLSCSWVLVALVTEPVPVGDPGLKPLSARLGWRLRAEGRGPWCRATPDPVFESSLGDWSW